MKPTWTTTYLIAVLLGSSYPIALAAEPTSAQWPQFRGPNASGIADEARPPIHFGPETNLLWKATTPPGLSAPVVWGERIFLTGLASNQLVTMAYDARNGRELWRRVAPAEKIESCHQFIYTVNVSGAFTVLRASDNLDVVAVNKLGESVRATPAIAGDALYVRSADHLWAFRARHTLKP